MYFFLFFLFFEFFKTLVGCFLIGENISLWMSPFRFESSCARDGGMWWIILHRGGPYLVVLSSGCGEFLLLWVILQRERHHDHIWIFEYSIFLWRQFRGGVMPLYGKWVCIWIIWFPPSPLGFLGCIKLITPYYCLFFLYQYSPFARKSLLISFRGCVCDDKTSLASPSKSAVIYMC